MKYQFVRFLMLAALLVGAVVPVTQVQAKPAAPTISSKGVSPQGMLNPDGTLKLDGAFNGTLDLAGYDVKIDPKRGPVFGPAQSGENAPSPALATSANWAAVGDGGGSIDDAVYGIAISGSNVYVVGSFTDAANIPAADFVAKWDGSNWSALGSDGYGDGAIGSYTYAVAVDGSGNVYVGGYFWGVYNGNTHLNTAAKIAKWDGSNWSALGSDGAGGPSINNGEVRAIAVDGSGNVYVGGTFTDVNNSGTVLTAADYVAKWNGTNWSALGSDGASNGSLNNQVYALVLSGTDLYVGGAFTDVNDNGTALTAADYIAKWNGTDWSALGSNGASNGSLNNYVYALAISGTDLYVGGSFTNVNDSGTSLPAADYLAKWDGTNWSAVGSNGAGNGSLNSTVRALLVNGSNLYVGGYFTNVNDNGTTLASADYVAKWDGSNWSALGDNGSGDGAIPSKAYPGILAFAMQGGNLITGGYFFDLSDGGTLLPKADHLAEWDGANWSSIGSDANGALVNGYLSSSVQAIAVIGTDVYVGGYFINISNHGVNLPAGDYIAKWDGSDWSALGSNGAGNGALNYQVTAMAVIGTDLYVGGGFTNVNDNGTVLTAADYLAKWDGSNWSALGDDGAGNGSLNGYVAALAVIGTDLYVGGGFTNVNDSGTVLTAADYVAKWDGSNWSALGSDGANGGSLDQPVDALAASGSNLYVGGGFTRVNDNGTILNAAGYIAEWNGSNWSALGSDGASGSSLNNWVYSIAVNGSDVYVGGSFSDVNDGGTALPTADYIAKWDGSHWSALGSNGFGNGAIQGRVNAVLVNGTDVYVTGGFVNVVNNGTTLAAADYIAKWDGSNWSALGDDGASNGSLTNWGETLSLSGSDLLVGGDFSNVNNYGTIIPEADYLAAYGIGTDVTPPTVQSITRADADPTSASSVDFAVAFSESVTGVDASDFEVIAGAGLSGVTLSGVVGSGSSYTVTVSTGTGNGTLGLNLADDDSIVDTSGNPLGGVGNGNGDFTGDVYSVAKTAPVQLLPADGTFLYANRPLFDWSNFAGAKGYQIQVSKSPKFGTYVLNASLSGPTNSQYTPTKDLPANTTVYWRVRAKLGSTKYTPWSSVFSLHTANPPSIPVLSAPANNALLTNLNPTLDWADSKVPAGTTFDHYQVQLDDNADFSSTLVDQNLAGVTNSSYMVGPLSTNTRYYWRVRSWNTNDNYSSWSATRIFREAMDAPVLVSPIGGITAPSLKPVFDWNDVAGATGYTIQVSLNSNFSTLVLNVTLKTSASTYMATTNLSHLKLYYWRVRANGSNGPSPWSTVETFMTP